MTQPWVSLLLSNRSVTWLSSSAGPPVIMSRFSNSRVPPDLMANSWVFVSPNISATRRLVLFWVLAALQSTATRGLSLWTELWTAWANVVRPVPASPMIEKGAPRRADRTATRRLFLTCSSRKTGSPCDAGMSNTVGTASDMERFCPAPPMPRRVILIRAKYVEFSQSTKRMTSPFERGLIAAEKPPWNRSVKLLLCPISRPLRI